MWIEHLDQLDVFLVGVWTTSGSSTRARSSPSARPGRSIRCTPVARVELLPEGVPFGVERRNWELAGITLTAALQLGLADRLTELAVAYAKERVQFDRPIGSFQAIKHLLADMVERTEVARAAVYSAGAVLDEMPARGRAVAWPTVRRSLPATPRSPTARSRRRSSVGWASPGRSTCTST